ncbi:excisionase [Marinobacter sp. BGYM27]|uniref:excisionase n=1 Tax=Marinobacter sp. BGYM27 TaxID=2975597 RepID=UPI0021A698A0|nr:excisionase [Marinobacter sp. BGYM27]MDG5498921.1 excisionase [Marinobacter sp. BGYM27]
MGKLMELSEWREKRFSSPPPLRTCQHWAAVGEIPAVKRGKKWFVDVEQEEKQTGNPLVDDILNGTKKAS